MNRGGAAWPAFEAGPEKQTGAPLTVAHAATDRPGKATGIFSSWWNTYEAKPKPIK